MEIRPVTAARAFEQVVDQIANMIRLGELEVGDRMPSERELAAAVGLSRPSLREAISLLVDVGVLEVRRGSAGGIFVVSTDVPRELMRSRVAMKIDEIRGVLEARRLFEPRVAHLAAAYARAEDLERMQATIDAQKRMLEDGLDEDGQDRFHVQDGHFHMRMAAATHNSTIVALMQVLMARLDFAQESVQQQPENPAWVIDIHQRTLAAIRKANHDEIDVVMEEHIRGLEIAWERSTDNSLVRPLPSFMIPLDERDHG
ncbi:FadR/GntR family transcriptional regulator [Nocardioides daeguensis]|uniref:FadR/GntR family transcriptional regulator n=1 Tax=Nocardioides daeguensis TaxID=908359 RepID=A0ABP6UZW0_9ACTN|nr:FCD domain-containing protein [Nocardioides daeguensis]MBV6727198.1 GntR family transcriptional regulator [Nocardioides daeguensis]MCR1771212.1 GntR family transcriptional regulator [Nocardioides daeguensis]